MKEVRLQKLIARYGYASRRKAEELIKIGAVKVNGITITKLGTKVKADSIIEISGKLINRSVRKIYLALNKPENFICTKSDDRNRPTIFSLLDKKYLEMGVFNVGRLDYRSKGLIFLTNDGTFANVVTHPSFEITKEYEVTTDSDIPYEELKKWTKGTIIYGEKYKIKSYKKISRNKVLLTLNEGKKREIRVLFNSINIKVIELKRIRIGNVTVNGIEEGKYRELTKDEVKCIYKNGQ